jgi:hypothetical protein
MVKQSDEKMRRHGQNSLPDPALRIHPWGASTGGGQFRQTSFSELFKPAMVAPRAARIVQLVSEWQT